MSAAPFTGSIVNAETGNTGTAAEQDVSDYGTDGTGSKSPSVSDIQDMVIDAGKEDSVKANSNDITTVYDGIHSDLFENLFQTLPINGQYRIPGSNPSGCSGLLLLPEQDPPTAVPALDAHADDGFPRIIIISRSSSERICCMFIGIHYMHSGRC